MIVSPDILRKELVSLLAQIDLQITEIKATAVEEGIRGEYLRDKNGNWPMIPLLSAKVQALSTLAQLNQYQNKER